jgi:hypothetical protein
VDNSEDETGMLKVVDLWISIKDRAIEKDTPEAWLHYKKIMQISLVELSKKYAQDEGDNIYKQMLEEMIKTATCELREINIKYKKSQVPF